MNFSSIDNNKTSNTSKSFCMQKTSNLFVNTQENQPTEVLSISSPLFLDQSPKTKLARILKNHGLINEKYEVIKKFDIDFSVDISQEKLIEDILEARSKFNYKAAKKGPITASCEFSLKELLSNISKQSSVHGNMQVNLSGGIVRRLFTQSPSTCSAIFERCKIPLPENLMKELLEEKQQDLPDIDVRFDFQSLQENYVEVLEQSRRFPLSFVCSKLEKDVQDITVEKVREFSLNKWYLRNSGKDKFSMLNFAEGKFSFSQIPSFYELLFVCDFVNRYLFSRDNIFLNIQPLLKEEKEKLCFHSINDKQLEAILHILLGKISLDHFSDPSGFIRIISLFTEGETFVNPLSDLEDFRTNFLESRGSNQDLDSYFSSYIKKCLENHHPNYVEDPLLVDAFFYNLISVFSSDCHDAICVAWEDLKVNSVLFEMFCKRISFEEVQATLGLAALVNMASTEMGSSKPRAILCSHGECLFIQFKLPNTEHCILIPFNPEKFINVLWSNSRSELIELFEKMCQTENILAGPSLLNAYHICNNNLFKDALEYLKLSKTGMLQKMFVVLEKSLQPPSLPVEEFAEKILLEPTSEGRLFWHQVFFQSAQEDFKKLKFRVRLFQEVVAKEPFEKEVFVKAWVSLLTQSSTKKLQDLAFSLLREHKTAASEMLQNGFTVDWMMRLLDIDGCLPAAQDLLNILQKRQLEKRIAPEIEQKVLTKLLQNKDLLSEKYLLDTYKILKNYLSRKEKLELPAGIFEFIHRFSQEQPEKAKKLLLITAEPRFQIEREKCQQAWVEWLKRDVFDTKISPEKIAEFWSDGERLKIWQGMETSEEYQNILLSLSERLTMGGSPCNPLKGFEFLEHLLSFKLEKGDFEKRIKEVFGCYIAYLITGKHTIDQSLELAKKQIEKYSTLTCDEEKCKYFFGILQAKALQKDWSEAEGLCDQVLKVSSTEGNEESHKGNEESHIKAWVSLLTQSPKKKLHDLAYSLLRKHKKVASKLLQNDFMVNWIMQLLEIDECLSTAQDLLIQLQKRQRRISPETEQKLITKLIQYKGLECEKSLLTTYKIFKDYFCREGKLEHPAGIFEFINRLSKEQPEKARELLVIATELGFVSEKQKCQQIWVECLKKSVCDPQISPEKIVGFWLKGNHLKIWEGAEVFEEYQNIILSLSERLATGESPCDPVKGFEFLERFLSFKLEKGDFEKRIKEVFDVYIIYLIKGKHKIEKPLELAIKCIKKHGSLSSEEEKFKYYLTILQARILQKDWGDAEILCDQLLKRSFAEKYSVSLGESIRKIFQVKGKKISKSILIQNKNFHLCIDSLSDFWLVRPLEVLEIVRNSKCLEEKHRITILNSAIIGVEKKEIEEQKKFLFDPLVLEQKIELDCAKFAKSLLKKLLESPQKNAHDCFRLFDYYLAEDVESWTLCTQSFSYCEDVKQVKSCFEKGVSLLKDPKTICESFIKFFEFLVKKKDLYALEMSFLFSQETGALYQSWLKADKGLQVKLLALFIQAEILMGACESISETKEYLLNFYEKLQSLKTEKEAHIFPSEQLFLKQLLRSDSENDQKKGLDLLCEKIKLLPKKQSIEQLKTLVGVAIEHVCSHKYLELPVKQMEILCEYVYSFKKIDPAYGLKFVKTFVERKSSFINSKIDDFICHLLFDFPKNLEKEFLQLLETYLFTRLSNPQNLSEIESAYRVLRSQQLSKMFGEELISFDLFHHLWIKYDEVVSNNVNCKKTISEMVERYFGIWLSMIPSPKHANVWSQKLLAFTEKKEGFKEFLNALCKSISENDVYKALKTSKKNIKVLPEIHSKEFVYCSFFNAMLLKTLESQKTGLEWESDPLMAAYLKKLIPFLQEYSFPSKEEETILSILFQYCCQCSFEQVNFVYKSIRELAIPKYHKNIFVPLVEKMLDEKNPNIHFKATILMKAFVCENKSDEIILKKLFEKMIDRAMEAVDKMSEESLNEFFEEVRQITITQRALNGSAPKIHDNLLQTASFYYLKKLCVTAHEYSGISGEMELFCRAHIAPTALSTIINSMEFFAQNLSENNASEFEGFLNIVSEMFSGLKKNREALSKKRDFLKKWVLGIGKVLSYVELICYRNSQITLNLDVYEKLVIGIRDWTLFLEQLGSRSNLQDHRLDHNLTLSRILELFPFEVKSKMLETLKDK